MPGSTLVPSNPIGAMTEPSSITWLSLRPEYWSQRRTSFPSTVGKLDIRFPEPIRGIACIAFAIGTSGAAWLERLSASQWFRGLEPRPDDIERDDLAVTGRLLVRDDDLRDPIGIGAMLERGAWPVVPVAAIAVPGDQDPLIRSRHSVWFPNCASGTMTMDAAWRSSSPLYRHLVTTLLHRNY